MAKPTVQEAAKRTLDKISRGAFTRDARDPYCLHEAQDYFPGEPAKVGHYLLVNRDYAPISTTISGDHPAVKAFRKGALNPGFSRIESLYDDWSRPQDSEKSLNAYVERLTLLCAEV